MKKVFISGSIKIRALKSSFLERLDKILLDENLCIILGDANGADKSIQTALHERNAQRVEIYCSGDSPRNNIGDWKINKIYTNAKHGTREFFTAKDKRMSQAADYGLMVWDGKSTGTLSNVLELIKNGKPSRVFVHKEQRFVTIQISDDIQKLLNLMSDTARREADGKIHLSTTVANLAQVELRV